VRRSGVSEGCSAALRMDRARLLLGSQGEVNDTSPHDRSPLPHFCSSKNASFFIFDANAWQTRSHSTTFVHMDGDVSQRWIHAWLPVLVLSVAAVAVYWPASSFDFVNWDDATNFTHNRHFRDWTSASIKWAWTTPHLSLYQPLAWTLMGFERVILGLSGPAMHVVGIALHALVSAVLYTVALRLVETRCGHVTSTRERAILAMAVALWALHPLRAEVVGWVSSQSYIISAAFGLGSLLAFLHARDDRLSARARRRAWILCGALCASAMLCKAVAVTLPLVFLAVDRYLAPVAPPPSGRDPHDELTPARSRGFLVFAPLFALSAASVVSTYWAKSGAGTLVALHEHGLSARLAAASFSIWFYLLKSVWPSDLSPYYPIPRDIGLERPLFGLCFVLTLLVTVGLWRYRKRWPGLCAAWAVYLIVLAPNMGLVRIGGWLAADRYAYFATMPWSVALGAWLLPSRADGARLGAAAPQLEPARRGATMAVAMAAIVIAVLGMRQVRTWRSSKVLWEHALVAGYDDWAIQHGLSKALADLDDRRGALAALDRAVQLDPSVPRVYEARGLLRAELGDLAGALRDHTRTIALSAHPATALNNRGIVRRGLGDRAGAMRDFTSAVKRDPRYAAAYSNRALGYIDTGDWHRARADLDRAIAVGASEANVYANRGFVRSRLGDVQGAEADLARAIEVDPTFPEAYGLRAELRLRTGRRAEAVHDYRRALSIAPGTWRYRRITEQRLAALLGHQPAGGVSSPSP
jgi:tetratricopeptide (TPR) repeat protein